MGRAGRCDAGERSRGQDADRYAQSYLAGGDAAIGNDFGDLLRSATTLYALAPEFANYLERFPKSTLAGVDQRLYWTNMAEGSSSIISLHHLVVYQRPAGDVIIADKTIYASRYFDVAALVLSMQETADGRGYYLIAGSRARSSRLGGVAGRIVRREVEKSATDSVPNVPGLDSRQPGGPVALGSITPATLLGN